MRLLVSFWGIILLSFLLVSPALADNGPHGGYTDLTDKCAACHRLHTATGVSLLKEPASLTDKSDFCYSCHSGGLGAYTDVKSGLFRAITPPPPGENTRVTPDLTPLKGGGFEQVKMNVDLNSTGGLVLPATSSHMVTGGSNTVWGYGAVTSPTIDLGAPDVALTCTNCHNPHGYAGTDNTPTYRILKGGSTNNTALFITTTGSVAPSVDVPDDPSPKRYGISASNLGKPENYFDQHVDSYATLTRWCAQCHSRYKAPVVDGSPLPSGINSGDAIFQFRHTTNSETSGGCGACHVSVHGVGFMPPFPACLSCHVAHGTGARMGSYSGSVPWPGGSSAPNGNGRSSLLRLDNRGVCQVCHNMPQ